MSIKLNQELNNFSTSNKQIELLESIEYIHGPQLSVEELLKFKSVNAFVKRYFESRNCQYTQILSVMNGLVTCKAFVDNVQYGECVDSTFNKARVKVAIMAMQEFDLDLLTSWLRAHKEDLMAYMNI